jgi:hypothetical protein
MKQMTAWFQDELRKIAGTDDLHISPFREDGRTYGTPTWIWAVVSRQVKQFEEGRMKSYPTHEHEHGNQTSWMTHIAIQKKKGRQGRRLDGTCH